MRKSGSNLKNLYIAEKPSVAREFAKALKISGGSKDGYIESSDSIVTWCVGHLVTMSYPEEYDEALKKWTLEPLPFLPEQFKYQVIDEVAKQFDIVKGLLNREDVGCIYVCTDSGREGEYIYRLVDQMAEVPDTKAKKRVWIDSQTEEEIMRGIKEAKDLHEYDNLCASAYLRAKEDYLMGINFSRLLTLKYSYTIKNYLGKDKCVVSVGRVMTCVLGMIVKREREIRQFVKTPFYRVIGNVALADGTFEAEWKAVEGTRYFNSPLLYKENGFKEEKDAKKLIEEMTGNGESLSVADTEKIANKETIGTGYSQDGHPLALIEKVEKKKENKNAPLLYNLAELQNDCSRLFKISPDQTLQIAQELYEKKLVTYPRTDARVLSTAVSKEIYKNISGLKNIPSMKAYAEHILESGSYKGIAKTRYVNDKQITDHYAIIPTGQGLNAFGSLHDTAKKVYEIIVRRFLSIFYPPAIYQKLSLTLDRNGEKLFANFKVLVDAGYLPITVNSFGKQKDEEDKYSKEMVDIAMNLKKGMQLSVEGFEIKEGETSPPKRYSSGTLILAMENAGQLIEDEELRAQIKGSGIGTSATRAEIIKKLVNNKYLDLNKKTQIITPTLMGEMIHDVVAFSIKSLLNPELTASWEKGLSYVAEGTITEDEYMKKLEDFIQKRTDAVKGLNNQYQLRAYFDYAAQFYKKEPVKKSGGNKKGAKKQSSDNVAE
ncbi:MAG: type IA DNA topoisomerase [Lachnospiraceae bacterium]|nr:type IA DNA topoisomerase [Lachnospiraceae bacterium]